MAKVSILKPLLGTRPVDNGFSLPLLTAKKASGGGDGGSADTGSDESAPAPAVDYQGELERLTKELYTSTFQPTPVKYTAQTEEELKTRIASWLRPSYEQAIENRREQTRRYGAELDADAIARGMGASTYVTDVKSRQQREEARDVSLLETDYGAVLAKNVSERLAAQEENRLETEMFNAEQEQAAYGKAYDAALSILSLMSAASGGGGSSGGGRRSSGGGGSSSSSKTGVTTAANCETFLSGLSQSERAAVYSGATAQDAAYRSEIIASVGASGYYKLQGKYSSLP